MSCAFSDKFVRIAAVTVILYAGFVPSGCAQSAQDDPAQQGVYTARSETDLSSKIDTTIKVLTVMKEEVERMNAEEKKAGTSSGVAQKNTAATTAANPEWAGQMRSKLSAMIRMWKRTDQIMNPQKAAEPGQPSRTDTATAELNAKIDSAIKAMEVIKEELDAVAKESATGTYTTSAPKK